MNIKKIFHRLDSVLIYAEIIVEYKSGDNSKAHTFTSSGQRTNHVESDSNEQRKIIKMEKEEVRKELEIFGVGKKEWNSDFEVCVTTNFL